MKEILLLGFLAIGSLARADFSYVNFTGAPLVVCEYTDSVLRRTITQVVSPRMLQEQAIIGGASGSNSWVPNLNRCQPLNREMADRILNSQNQILLQAGYPKPQSK
jgi:hypothetical protein